jgi:hypothetical protein
MYREYEMSPRYWVRGCEGELKQAAGAGGIWQCRGERYGDKEDERADRAPAFRSLPGGYLCAVLIQCHGVDMSPSLGGLGLLVWD